MKNESAELGVEDNLGDDSEHPFSDNEEEEMKQGAPKNIVVVEDGSNKQMEFGNPEGNEENVLIENQLTMIAKADKNLHQESISSMINLDDLGAPEVVDSNRQTFN